MTPRLVARTVVVACVVLPMPAATQATLELRDRIDGYQVEFGRIGAITAADDGRIYVADVLRQEVAIMEDGRRLARLGRSGSGPGEYTGLASSIAWAGDVLVTLDYRQRRLTLWYRDGRHLRTLPVGRPVLQGSQLHSAGNIAYLQALTRQRLVPGGAPPPDVEYIQVTREGTLLPVPAISDVAIWPPSTDCMWRNGQRIDILPTPYADWQPMRAFTNSGEFVRASREEFRIDVIDGETGRVIRSMRRAVRAAAPSLREWQAMPEIAELVRREAESGGALRDPGNPSEPCQISATSPIPRPVIRSIVTDELSRTWAEVPRDAGFALALFDASGWPLAEVAMPNRDPTVAPFVRGNLLYIATIDDLGVQSIEVYELRLP